MNFNWRRRRVYVQKNISENHCEIDSITHRQRDNVDIKLIPNFANIKKKLWKTWFSLTLASSLLGKVFIISETWINQVNCSRSWHECLTREETRWCWVSFRGGGRMFHSCSWKLSQIVKTSTLARPREMMKFSSFHRNTPTKPSLWSCIINDKLENSSTSASSLSLSLSNYTRVIEWVWWKSIECWMIKLICHDFRQF